MAYKMKLELTGLKLEIEHDGDGFVPPAVVALQRQLTGVMQTVNALAAGAQKNGTDGLPGDAMQNAIDAPLEPVVSAVTRNRGKGARRSGGGKPAKAVPIDFKHNAEKYGFPKREWNTATKAMWLLYVLGEQTEHKEASPHTLSSTFAKYFREFGKILPHNIKRDLGAEKSKSRHVNDDPSQEPATWHLLDEGRKAMERLIQNPTETVPGAE